MWMLYQSSYSSLHVGQGRERGGRGTSRHSHHICSSLEELTSIWAGGRGHGCKLITMLYVVAEHAISLLAYD